MSRYAGPRDRRAVEEATEPRLVHVVCDDAEGFRWFKRNLSGIATETGDGFLVTNESRWSEALAAAGGREVK